MTGQDLSGRVIEGQVDLIAIAGAIDGDAAIQEAGLAPGCETGPGHDRDDHESEPRHQLAHRVAAYFAAIIATVMSSMRLEKPHSLSYQAQTFTSVPPITLVSVLS